MTCMYLANDHAMHAMHSQKEPINTAQIVSLVCSHLWHTIKHKHQTIIWHCVIITQSWEVILNPHWHDLWKQDYKTQWAWQGVKLIWLMSIFTSKIVFDKNSAEKSDPKKTWRSKCPPCPWLMTTNLIFDLEIPILIVFDLWPVMCEVMLCDCKDNFVLHCFPQVWSC